MSKTKNQKGGFFFTPFIKQKKDLRTIMNQMFEVQQKNTKNTKDNKTQNTTNQKKGDKTHPYKSRQPQKSVCM